jgi:3-hydroxyacyl-CoA dehydrogenase/enoyl-CoA hydratase/3-hydroxybutyryl-CoA epimerase
MLMQTNTYLRKWKAAACGCHKWISSGGCEVALACHHRIMSNHPKSQIGLVECSVGLFPGAGGTQRF